MNNKVFLGKLNFSDFFLMFIMVAYWQHLLSFWEVFCIMIFVSLTLLILFYFRYLKDRRIKIKDEEKSEVYLNRFYRLREIFLNFFTVFLVIIMVSLFSLPLLNFWEIFCVIVFGFIILLILTYLGYLIRKELIIIDKIEIEKEHKNRKN